MSGSYAQPLVYFFGQGRADGTAAMKDVLGGKGAGLAEMTNAGLPVPPGFTITTEACNAYYTAGANAAYPECGNKPQWAGLSCVSHPKANPSPGGNPPLPWTWITSYNSLDLPTVIQEKVNGEVKRTTTASYDATGRPVQSDETGDGIEVPPSETLYSASTGARRRQRPAGSSFAMASTPTTRCPAHCGIALVATATGCVAS